jgi:DNA-binding response OmpR family regulator
MATIMIFSSRQPERLWLWTGALAIAWILTTAILMLSSIADDARRIFDVSTLPIAELIEKPIQPAELLQRVERLLARTKG